MGSIGRFARHRFHDRSPAHDILRMEVEAQNQKTAQNQIESVEHIYRRGLREGLIQGNRNKDEIIPSNRGVVTIMEENDNMGDNLEENYSGERETKDEWKEERMKREFWSDLVKKRRELLKLWWVLGTFCNVYEGPKAKTRSMCSRTQNSKCEIDLGSAAHSVLDM
ncbi:hypothetical protein Syun_024011 [Stephania yunnanensis]|uniref:Uncharacterized protein n=1 Tax=Stephania yunnanensis TaxID=152371 RepID=A0AAP0I3S0_9MAGN